MSAEIVEYPSLCFRDIRKKPASRTDGQRGNSIPHPPNKVCRGGGGGLYKKKKHVCSSSASFSVWIKATFDLLDTPTAPDVLQSKCFHMCHTNRLIIRLPSLMILVNCLFTPKRTVKCCWYVWIMTYFICVAVSCVAHLISPIYMKMTI